MPGLSLLPRPMRPRSQWRASSSMLARAVARRRRRSCARSWMRILLSLAVRSEETMRFDRRLVAHFDWLLLLLTLALLSIGVMGVYSATYVTGQRLSPWMIRQLSWAAL